MKTKHSTGKWSYKKTLYPNVYKVINGNKQISIVTHDLSGNPDISKESKANAQVFISAPELLEALLLAKKLIDELEDKHTKIAHKLMIVDDMIKIESAIKKATK